MFIENVNSYFDYVGGLTFRGTGDAWGARFTATDYMASDGSILMIQTEEPSSGVWGATIATFNNDGNVGIGTPTPQSKLQIANGYLQLATVTGMPPAADCDNQAEYGRMMVSPADSKLWICVAAGWISK